MDVNKRQWIAPKESQENLPVGPDLLHACVTPADKRKLLNSAKIQHCNNDKQHSFEPVTDGSMASLWHILG